MRLNKMMRGASAWVSAALVASVLTLGAAHATHDGAKEANDFSRDQVTYIEKGPRGLTAGNPPDPPPAFILIETSANGSALGLELSALVENLVQAVDDDSALDGDAFHEVVCFAISWLLGNRIDPGGPREMTRTINAYLVANDLPPIDYSRAKPELEAIYEALERGLSSEALSREVADALCDAE